MILLYPIALLLLLPFSVIALWFMHPRSIAGTRLPGQWHKVVSPALRHYLLGRIGGSEDRSLKIVAFCALLMILTLAHPIMTTETHPPHNFKASVLVLDMSPGVDVEKQRFFVDSLLQKYSSSAGSESTATGLVLVGESAYSVVPITEDIAHIQRYLGVASPGLMPLSGRVLHEGIAVAESMLADSRIAVGQVVIITSGRAVENLPSIPDRGRLRDLVITEGSTSIWNEFSELYGAQVHSSIQSEVVDRRLDKEASEKFFRGVQAASIDLRPPLLGLALLLWLWFFRRRVKA